MDFPIPPSSWWSTDTINYQSIKKVQYNQVAEEHQKFWLKVCRYLAMAAGRAIARVGYQLYYYPKSVTNTEGDLSVSNRGLLNFTDFCGKLNSQ